MSDHAEQFEANRLMWDERVPIHVGSDFYDSAGFKAGRETLEPHEIEELGDVGGERLVHLQCHFGHDTLSWARHGASVTGLDFSAPAIEAARSLANDIGVAADFVVSDVHDARAALEGDFDIVYTSHGALNWLPDLDRWAGVVDSLLRPGGMVYVSEFHPFVDILDDDLRVEFDYFQDPATPIVWDEPGTYADESAVTKHNLCFEWIHPVGEVVSSLTTRGYRLAFLHEHGHTLFKRFPWLEPADGGRWVQPAGRKTLPFMYSLKATKPE